MKEYSSISWKYVYLAFAEIWNFPQDFSVYFFIHLFLHNLLCSEFESVGKHSIFDYLHLQISKAQNGH